MQTSQLLKRNLVYYWRTNLAVVLGVAIAVAVLSGALLVGDSVRSSLRDLFLQRLGNTDYVIAAPVFFRQQLSDDLQKHSQFPAAGFKAAVPLIALEGAISHERSGKVGSGIKVYGVDERFWTFHHRQQQTPLNRDILVSDNLARELGSQSGDALLLRIQKPSEIPIESLHSRKEELGQTLRLTVRDSLAPEALGEFALQPQQTATRAAFVSLSMLQRELAQDGKVNTILIANTEAHNSPANDRERSIVALNTILKESAQLDDYGIKLRKLDPQQTLAIESDAGYISDPLAQAFEHASTTAQTSGTAPYLSYLVNGIRRDDGHDIPYSIITGVNFETLEMLRHNGDAHPPGCDVAPPAKSSVDPQSNLPPILLNEWAANDLHVKIGERVTLDYFLWLEEGKLATRSAEFRLACVIPFSGIADDRDLVPDYPGITESETLGDWNPPFPIDLKRVRPQDEGYWKQHRTTPKGFIMLQDAQRLWQSRFGKVTSLRTSPKIVANLTIAGQTLEQSLRSTLSPAQMGFAVLPVRALGLQASRGATDFGEYFLYFSFFLVVSALMLTALFFKLGIEQRLREIGVLQATGFSASRIRFLFLREGTLLSVLGSVLGLGGAIAYSALMMLGLRTWWVDAVGTNALRLYISGTSLLLGALGGIFAAVLCVVVTLRHIGKQSTRSLLTGTLTATVTADSGKASLRRLLTATRSAVSFTVLALLLLLAAALGWVGQVPGFFGGGTLLLVAAFCHQAAWLRRDQNKPIHGAGFWPLMKLGFRSASYRPARSVLCIALIASAAFIIVAVDAFRHRENTASTRETKSGNGGYPFLAESLLPVVHDLNTTEGRQSVNLTAAANTLDGISFARFRVRPGDDASCLNLYQPGNPKVLGVTNDFMRANRFVFSNSLASSPEEKENPWLLLNREFTDGAIPVIADANSLSYVLHRKLGEDIVLNTARGTVRLRVVAALADSLFQSELLMGEPNFLRAFPEQEGYRFFLIDAPTENASQVTSTLEDQLADLGFDVVPTSERLASFHRVENTYLSTFQMLGALGLLLGTLGMGAVLLRNVLERQRELALLRAVGYNSRHFALIVVAENALLLISGLLTGTVCALLAISPVIFSRHAQLPGASLGLLLLAVLVSGLTISVVATRAALRLPLIPSLRAE
jgi:ABC-type antimicrobial peptide transport system permease subunit